MGGRKQSLKERWEYAVGQDGVLDLYRNGVAVGFLGRQFGYLQLCRTGSSVRKGVVVTLLPGGAQVEERK